MGGRLAAMKPAARIKKGAPNPTKPKEIEVRLMTFRIRVMCMTTAALLSAVAISASAAMILYLPFDEELGDTVSDRSGNGFVGNIIGGATWVGGKFHSALDFDGTSGIVDFGDQAALRRPADITLEAWVKVRDGFPIQFAAGVPYRDTPNVWSSPWVGHHIGVEKDQFLSWLSIDSTNRQWGVGAIETDTWYHIAMTFDGTWRRSYLNGEELYASDEFTGPTVFEGSPHFVVGARSIHAPGEYFGGTVDEVIMYDEVNAI